MDGGHDVEYGGRRAPSVRDVLALPCVRAGAPRLLAGDGRLDDEVRWVHVSELTDIAPLLRGGELVLSTGIGLPDDDPTLTRYVQALAAAEVRALVIELGRRFQRLPDALVAAARAVDLPLIALEREVRFVEVTEAVHTRVIDAQVERLRRSERIHQRFTELTVEGASVERIADAASSLCETPVVLENADHQALVVASAGADEPSLDALLVDFEARSRAIPHRPAARRHPVDDTVVWTVVPVATRGRRWGRLIAIGGGVEDTGSVLERTAAALAINRLSEHDEVRVALDAHTDILDPLLHGNLDDPAARQRLMLRAAAIGVPLADRALLGCAVRLVDDDAAVRAPGRLQRDLTERLLDATRAGGAALIQRRDDGLVHLVVSAAGDEDPRQVVRAVTTRLFDDLARTAPDARIAIGIGTVVDDVTAVRRSVDEAAQTARALTPATPDAAVPFHGLDDVRLPGLLTSLIGDRRLANFVARELGPLLADDAPPHLFETLRAVLEHGGNKRRAAAQLGISRTALYDRIDTLTRHLPGDIDDAVSRTSLHVAVLAHAIARDPASVNAGPDAGASPPGA
ncbi:MAG: PucR family transcriptional regulator ligand-binding domain-containing protein [Nitriliruptoraceae bacterium]|nr:PucR family transcriptional regulator ligand-binding domain-containing protein [Nitriliruptoraceae bacterium]